MRWSGFLTEYSTFFLSLTKKIDLPSSENRLMTGDLSFCGTIPHLSPEILSHQFFVSLKIVSKMNKPPPIKL